MKTTKFDQTIAMGIAGFIKFLDTTLEIAADDPCVSTEIFVPALLLSTKIHDAAEEYSETMLKIYGVED